MMYQGQSERHEALDGEKVWTVAEYVYGITTVTGTWGESQINSVQHAHTRCFLRN